MGSVLARFGPGRGAAIAALLAAAVVVGGCESHASRIAGFRESWGAGNYEAAEQAIDQLISSDTGVPVETVWKTAALDPQVQSSSGNTYLLLLEKAMVRLARWDPITAVKVLLKARDELDKHYTASFKDYFAATMTDDESMSYAGADYEHIMVRVLLAVVDLLIGEGDAYAYALQVGEKQEEIIGSDFGDAKNNYYPRRQYKRVAIGAYVQGVIQEANLFSSEAALAYERGLSYAGQNPALQAALQRARASEYAPDGHGVLHVFYLAGRGPHLEQTQAEPTSSAIALAGVGLTLMGKGIANLGQQAVPVPRVVVSEPTVPPLSITADMSPSPTPTVTILDVNQVAVQQLEANMQGIIARAMVRRIVKGAVGSGIEQGVGGAEGALMGLLFTAIATGVERAETRNWVSLPAQIQVARVPLPEGDRRVHFGPGMECVLRVARGRDSYAVIVRPNLTLPGVVVVDRFSFIAQKPPEVLPPVPAPGTAPGAAPGAAPQAVPPGGAPAKAPVPAPATPPAPVAPGGKK